MAYLDARGEVVVEQGDVVAGGLVFHAGHMRQIWDDEAKAVGSLTGKPHCALCDPKRVTVAPHTREIPES